MIEQILQYGTLIVLAANIIGIFFVIDKKYKDPDQKAETKMAVMEKTCELKHSTLDNTIADMRQDIVIIKQNHLHHIEQDISNMKTNIGKILTILDERNK